MRVLIDYRPALRARSGAGEYIHHVAAALASSVDVTIFSSSWKDRLRVPADLNGTKAVDLRVPVSILNRLWHRLEWPPVELLTGSRFDVVHSPHPLLMPARSAARVITIHDLNFLSHPERTQREIRRDYPVLARAHARRADAIIVSSRFTAGEVVRLLGVDAGRISICAAGAPAWTPRTTAPANGYALFLGTLEPRKNVGGLLDAYERLLAHRTMPELVLAGQATSAARPWLERIARPPLAGQVRHIGYVDQSALRELYAGARVLVMPSFEEGFGLPVLEAMTAGVPVVASNRGALPEVLGDAGLLIDPERADDLASALDRIVSDDAFAQACAARGVERARRFSWRETAAQVVDVYRQAVERRTGAHRH